MNAVVVYDQKMFGEEIEKGTDIILCCPFLFGITIFTEVNQAITDIYYTFKWKEATVGGFSKFLFPDMTKEQVIELLKETIKGIVIRDPREEKINA